MNAPSYTWMFTISGILHGLLITAMLVIVWIGWLRQRRLGFLVLVAWALVTLFNIAGQSIWFGVGRGWLTKLFPTASPNLLMALPSVLGSLASSGLLLAGLGLLAFRNPAAAKREPA